MIVTIAGVSQHFIPFTPTRHDQAVFIASGGHANGLDPAMLKALGMLRRKSEARTILKESSGELPQHAQGVKAGGLFGGGQFLDGFTRGDESGRQTAGRSWLPICRHP